jgi:hypothetical protein
VGKLIFLVFASYGELRLSSNDFYLESSLVPDLLRVEMINISVFCFSSRRRFMLCLACIPYLGVGTGVQR